MAAFGLALAQATWLFLPLLFAAALGGVVIRLDWLRWARRPIDLGASWRGVRLFGDNKTWRGLLVAVVAAGAATTLQGHVVGDAVGDLAVVDWQRVPALLFGACMGLGAILGELPNSFVKRRVGIAPGRTTKGPWAVVFYVWDQVDLLFGAWPLVAVWVAPTPRLVGASFVLALALHPLVSLIGWAIGARRTAR